MATTDKRATANPTKQFFVTMITRDITLEDCILDLIDNSIDGAWSCEGGKPIGLAEGADLAKYRVDIIASGGLFSIIDNCGGMTLDDAVNHAFSFGRPAKEEHDQYSIGVYGIGMKRAVFKIGRDIKVRSTYKTAAGLSESFVVPINVNSWLNDDTPPWDFDIEASKHLISNGVEISINDLTDGAAAAFESAAFLQNLRRTISRDYSLHLNRGLTITLNGEKITGWTIELRQSDIFAPVRVEYTDHTGPDDVLVEIIAGMAAPPPEDSDPDEEDEGDKRYGWYVVCNGRIVLAADKSTVAGWGTDNWPQWHRQYSGFIGIILFTSANAAALPMTTTKRSVDQSSEVYRRAKPRMRDASRAWIDYTNVRKQALEAAKEAEAAAKTVSIYQVAPRASVNLPKLVAAPRERVANVAYSVPLARLKRLAKELGNSNMSYRDVGLKTFDYAFDDFVGED
ncbi:ATP-binding protein [Rhizobium sp. R86522]|uniref:ATP-binding protein n=1 Tax=Rhizobium sp. R86522 TaxID=3093861 RepID=UPI00366B9C14